MNKQALQNVKLRTGLVSSIDIKSVTGTDYKNLVPSGYKLSGGNVERTSYNIENARKNMISAFEELKLDNLTISILCTKENEEIAKAIVNCWQTNIGVELNGTITAVDNNDYYAKIKSGEYSIVIYDLTVDSDKSADFLSIFMTGNKNNFFGYSSEEYDRIVSDLKKNSTKENIVSCESYLLKNAVVTPIRYKNTVVAVAKDVSGIYSAGDSANIYFYKGIVD